MLKKGYYACIVLIRAIIREKKDTKFVLFYTNKSNWDNMICSTYHTRQHFKGGGGGGVHSILRCCDTLQKKVA